MTSNDPPDPGVGFQAAVGIFVGALVTGLASLGLAVADVSTGAFLSTLPTLFTSGLIVGALAAWARPGVAERLGARRWRAVEATVPAFLVGGGATALFLLEVVSSGLRLVPAAIAALALGFVGWTVAAMAHDTHVESITDEPALEWPWKRAGVNITAIGIGMAFLAVGIALASLNGRSVGAFIVAAMFLFLGVGPALSGSDSSTSFPSRFGGTFETDIADRPHASLTAHDEGLVVEHAAKPAHKKLVPWDRITDVRLTGDELVLERRRRWRSAIRCDRAVIDDPEGVVKTVRTYADSSETEKAPATATD